MAAIGVGQIWEGYNTATVVIGSVIAVLTTVGGVAFFVSRIVVLNDRGFREFPHKWVNWSSVMWAEIEEIPAWMLPNYAIAIVSKTADGTGWFMQYTLAGSASFRRGVLEPKTEMINDFIARANPGEVISPRLHSSARPDNR